MSVERRMRQILVEMTFLGYGKVQAFNSSGGGRSDNPDPTPTGESWPLHLKWLDRWNRAIHEDERDSIVRDAETELWAWRIKCVYTPDDFDETAWLLEDGEGYGPDEVARRFNTTPTRVRRLRVKDARDPETGTANDSHAVQDNSAERVVYLHSKGCTLRQIEMQTGVSKSRVQRLVKEAA